MKRTSDRKKEMAAARLGMSTDSDDVPQTAQGGEPIVAQTPSSVLGHRKGCDRAYALDFGEVSEPSGGLKN